MTSSTSGSADQIADLYAFLSGVIADPPEAEAIEQLRSGLPSDEGGTGSPLEDGFSLLRERCDDLADPAAAAEELRRVHTGLFVGPRPKLQVHESWYADDYLGRPLAAVKRSYRDLGILPAEQLREEADHAAVELAALGLLARDGDDHRRAFLRAHGWWLPDLAADIQEAAEEPFYEAIGLLIEGVLEADAHVLGIDLEELSPGYDLSPRAPVVED